MSLQSGFLQVPLKNAIEIYINEVIPRLTKKNKVIGISVAIFMSLILLIRDRVFKPPRNLRHIPYFGYYSLIKSIASGESLYDRSMRVHVPLVNSSRDGLYVEPGKSGWEVHVCNPEDMRRIFYKHEQFLKDEFGKGCEQTLLSKFTAGPNIGVLVGEPWKAQRKIVNPAFRRSVPVKLFGKIAQDLFEVMDTKGETVEVSNLMSRCTLEAIGRAGFGFEFNAIKDSKSKWSTMYGSIAKGLSDHKFYIFPVLDQSLLWLFPKRKLLHQYLDEFLSVMDEIILHKRELIKNSKNENNDLEENEKDFLTLMIESELRDEGVMSNEELKANLCLFFVAGHDTTASAICVSLYYLARFPEAQKKAREEAISILGDDPKDVLPSVENTKKMNYITQVMKEGLRLNAPIGAAIIPRLAGEDTFLSGTLIPKGTSLIMNMFNIHHSEKYWENPEQFKPERFENDNINTSWLPFGSGARQCIGMNFSLIEQRVILSMLLRKYTWTIPEDSIHKDRLITSGFPIIVPHGGLDLRFLKRY
nr:cytochrome P450 monooxygenase [Thamnidium elegans]